MLTVAVAAIIYEWIHYLVHTDYKPKSRPFRAVYRHHRLHHFKNENFWLTVTTANTADRIFGTNPDPADVPTSPTAKNLHALS
jgi:sterol desaturase/sphingolipid hydroxylase (fatty acid hydroxylase superfamily)